MSAIIYWQNHCDFRCVKAFMHAFSGRFSRASLEGISFNFFVCFILNVSIGSAPKRKNFDIQRNTRVGSGCQFTSNLLSCHHINKLDETKVLVGILRPDYGLGWVPFGKIYLWKIFQIWISIFSALSTNSTDLFDDTKTIHF